MKLRRIGRHLAGFVVTISVLSTPSGVVAQLTDKELNALDERVLSPSHGDPLTDPEGRAIVVLTTYSKTNFFIDQTGKYRGFEYEILKGYEKYINRQIRSASRRRFLIFVPMRFQDILPALAEGRGDIAAANFTVTDERSELVDFADPYLDGIDEVVVAHRDAPQIETVEELAGRTVYVLSGTSYVEHLMELNRRFESEDKSPITIVESDPDFNQIDVLQLVDSGVVELTVSDSHTAALWSQVFENLAVQPAVTINRGSRIAWAIRKGAPDFKASVNAYVKKIKKGTLTGNIAFKNYFQSLRWVKNPLDPIELEKLETVVSHMKHYSERYGWDWIAAAAQAYQESGLDHSKVSPSGAVGIMQVLPSTAAQKPINIENVKNIENNIHAGVKYMSFIRNRYFNEPEIAPAARVDFSWAAYNAGPARIQKLRQRAAKRGFDPNRWFNNVEHIASESIGRETVDYVANINKYYVAYRFAIERQERILAEREQAAEAAERARSNKALEAWRRTYLRLSERRPGLSRPGDD